MKIKIRGVRGSIPVPGPDTVKYGGNTTCIEITTDDGDIIIIDAGTGIRPLGLELMQSLPVNCSIFITHTHWDHIQGLPFFIPLFVAGNNIHFYGSFDPINNKDLKEILSQQMQYCYFPVRENELKASLEYNNIIEGQVIEVGTARVTSILMNHPVLNFGYKIEADGKMFFFTGDHEPALNIYDSQDDEYEDYQRIIDEQEQVIFDFIQNADCAVIDSQYTVEEYKTKSGWGHSTYFGGMYMAEKTGIKNLYLTHHDPERKDVELDEIYRQLLHYKKEKNYKAQVYLATEGVELQLS
ncbi:MAG: MBL fold metallo-hydrolase [Proteobacteria bacterium]|nr:MBL fold metallo-hydrolase [Pseudomonadota bacterium]